MPMRDLAGLSGTVALPTLSIGPAVLAQTEGSGGGSTAFTYVVTRTGDLSRTITAAWSVSGTGASPANAADFVGGALPSGTIVIAAGQTSATVSVPVVADGTIENDEGFTVTLSAAQMSVATTRATAGGAILNDDLAPDGYDVIVLAGQSNMIGRNGPVDAALDAVDPRILQYGFDAQSVTVASHPLDHQDETASTVGLGLAFAKAYLQTIPANRKVLLVPCAKGGSGFASGFWRAGGGGDAPAIARTNAAMAQSAGAGAVNRLAAMLWHQGESDQAATQPQYETDLDALIARWRASMTGAGAQTPFVCGGLLAGGAQTGAGVVAALAATPARTGYTAFAASTGLVGSGDNLHFDAASQRTFGGRYAAAVQSATTNVVTPNVPAAPMLAAAAGAAQVTLTIVAGSSGGAAVTGYTIYRGTASGAEALIASNVSSPYTDTGRVNGTAYYYRAAAVNAVGVGAQSAEVSATPVAAAQGTNLFTQPQAFDTWSVNGVAVATDVAANPVGGATNADRITQVANTSNHSVTTPAGQGGTASGQSYSYAVDVKSISQQYVQLYVSSAIASSTPYANFDVVAGSVLQQGNCTAAVADLGGGWKRVSMTFQTTGAAPFAAVIELIGTATTTRGLTDPVAAGAEKSLLLCNAQAVTGASPNAF